MEPPQDASSPVPPEVYEQLVDATPDERTDLILRLIEEHPQETLALPRRGRSQAVLTGIDLSSSSLLRRGEDRLHPAWWDPERRSISLRGANLQGANLRGANLQEVDLRDADLQNATLGGSYMQGCLLENANLQGADLADAHLQGAQVGGADLRSAMLEGAYLQRTALRFAKLQRSALDEANLQQADLWGADLRGAVLEQADMRRARLLEANLRAADLSESDLREADLRGANFHNANLQSANLQEAKLTGATFEGAILKRARLQGMILLDCDIKHIHLSGAWLDKTRLDKQQLGGALGEELNDDYESASYGYLALEQNFENLGDPDAARWAYTKKRRMQKLYAKTRAQIAFKKREWEDAAYSYLEYVQSQFVEWLCGYGESIPRTLASIVVLYIIFTTVYMLTGSVVRIEDGTVTVLIGESLEEMLDVATFSLVTMTSAEGPEVGLEPVNRHVHVLMGLQTLLTIALTGLLGFVLGNRIRR